MGLASRLKVKLAVGNRKYNIRFNVPVEGQKVKGYDQGGLTSDIIFGEDISQLLHFFQSNSDHPTAGIPVQQSELNVS